MQNEPKESPHGAPGVDSPTFWDGAAFRRNWENFLESSVQDIPSGLPLKRVRFQVEQTALFQEIVRNWDEWDGSARLSAWKRLLEDFDRTVRQVLPTCVQCGECCRRGSPTLHLEDLELLRMGAIPWQELVTLRLGEPAYSPFHEKAFFLTSECLKIREKPSTKHCTFLDEETSRCTIYANRPVQCRAQACWDSAPAKQLSKLPFLSREDVFAGVDLLLDIMAEHDRRFAFQKVHEAFKRLKETGGEGIDEVLELLAFEEHFRSFCGERFKIPADQMDLVFGRSLAELAPLFGFRVRYEPDGSRVLVPDEP